MALCKALCDVGYSDSSGSLKPPRLYGVPAMLAMLARHYAGFGLPPGALPDPEKALRHPDGLAGICTDMSVPTLKAAYARGLFPLAHIGPQKWWAPPERMVSFPEAVHISKTTRRLLRIKQFEVTFDIAFAAVMTACAEPRPGRMHVTWIRPDVLESYQALHTAGLARLRRGLGPIGEPRRRIVRGRHRQSVLYRIHVCAAPGRLQSRLRHA